ncbi:MAG: YggS family pyridoxal phosphate enzyme, partial [Gammaproteobacteria bacterium]|nr:YggS family pyridoxal phosphate enzyme [Gammaproteobacteria bacterium]
MDVAENLLRLNEEINAAKQKYHCTERDIILLAVSKQQPIEKMHAAIDAGQQHFAENYLQEALEKIAALANK